MHHPDRARGTAKFRLTLEEGQALVAGMRGNISGLCQPTYVVDIPGGYGKTPVAGLAPSDAPSGAPDKTWKLVDYRGQTHDYVDN